MRRFLQHAMVLWLVALFLTSINSVSFAVEIPIAPGSWTLAILPDTQLYSQSFPQHFTKQTEWLRDHAASQNIKYVLHEGDITNTNTVAQWNNAKASMDLLNDAIPYAMSSGNHDDGPGGNSANRNSLFNDPAYFGPGSFYASQPSIGGFYEAGKTVNSYHTFNAGNEDWLVMMLEWGPSNQMVNWANQVVAAHPNHKAILVTHAFLYHDDTRYDWASKGNAQEFNPHATSLPLTPGETVNDGEELWDKLVSQHDNFQFVFNGHVLGDGTGYRSDLGSGDNVVHQLLSNYQMKTQGGWGDMRLLEFKTNGDVEVRTYSPVQDRYDTFFDQQFTLNLNQLRGPLMPPAPPPLSTAVAANLSVPLPTTSASNFVGTIQVPQSSSPGVTVVKRNLGDYQLAIGGSARSYYYGVMIPTITQNERSDFAGRRATVEVGRNSFLDNNLALSVMEAGNPAKLEVNFNVSVAYFQFQTGWKAAHVSPNGQLVSYAYNGVDPSMVSRTAAGRYTVDLGVDSRTDGLLFATGGSNDNIVVQTSPFADGNGWDVRVEDNATNFAATGENRDFSFVYLPYSTPGLIGGLYDGVANSHTSSVGNFTMNRLASGQYELTVTGQTPQTGMLIMSVAKSITVGPTTGPDDNVLTYEPSANGTFLINSYDLPGTGFEDTGFAWAFINFANPIAPLKSGDYDRNGDIDNNDFVVWKSQFGASGSNLTADGNGDGIVNAADYTIWRKAKSAAGSGSGTGFNANLIPEPTTVLLALLLAPFGCLRRIRRHPLS